MPADISGYDYKILEKGYEATGDVVSGYGATVPYFLPWSQAFAFADEIMGRTSATTTGPITWRAPYKFPASVAPIYAQRVRIKPCGVDTSTGLPVSAGANGGLAPGEFWSHAIVTVEFASLNQSGLSTDDPNGLNQLDPDNPLTMCSQSVRASGKMETRKNGSYLYDGSLKPVPGDFAVPVTESKLVLSFPRVPYLPWQLVRPYLNTLNTVAMLGVGVGELLFDDFSTRVEPGPNGLQQQLELLFSVSPEPGITWNHLPQPDGSYALVRRAVDKLSGSPRRIFAYSDFRQIFNQITYVEA